MYGIFISLYHTLKPNVGKFSIIYMYGMGDISKIYSVYSKIDHHDHRLDTGTSMMKETKYCLN